MQTQIELAEYLKEDGIQRAEDHANRKVENWTLGAIAHLRDFLCERGTNPFMGEDVRLYAERKGFPCPPSKTAWGAIMRRAKAMSLIRCIGFGFTSNPLAHRTPASLWAKA